MTDDYLREHATTIEACNWLAAKTGKTWMLARLLENGLMPWFWFDYSPRCAPLFGNRREGYLAPMIFAGDTQRLKADGADVLITLTHSHDGVVSAVEPGVRLALADLRFKRDDVERVAEIINGTMPVPTQSPKTPAPVVAREVRSGNVLTLPNGHTHVLAEELPLLIANAQWPDDGTDEEGWEINHASCEDNSETEIKQAIQSGALPVKKPSTFAPLTYRKGNAWKTGLVTVTDLQIFLAERGMTLSIAGALKPQAATTSAAHAVAAGVSSGVRPASTNWKMKVQAEAASRFKRLRASGASPTTHSILDDMVIWCRDNDVKTDGGIYPKAGYLRTHVLGGKHWTPPK